MNGTPKNTSVTHDDGAGSRVESSTSYNYNGEVSLVTTNTSGVINKVEVTSYNDNGQISSSVSWENGIQTETYYENGILRSKHETGPGINRTTEYYPNGNIASEKETKKENNFEVEITTWHDTTGQVTGTSKEGGYHGEYKFTPADTGLTTIVGGGKIEIMDSIGHVTTLGPGEVSCVSPTDSNKTTDKGSEQKNGIIIITNGILPGDTTGQSGGFSCTEESTGKGLTLETHPGGQRADLYNEQGGVPSGSLFRFKFDPLNDEPKLEFKWSDPLGIYDFVLGWDDSTKTFSQNATDPGSGNVATVIWDPFKEKVVIPSYLELSKGLRVDTIKPLTGSDTTGLFFEPNDVTLKYADIIAESPRMSVIGDPSKIKFDVSTNAPRLEVLGWDPTPGLFKPFILKWDTTITNFEVIPIRYL